MRRGRSPQPVGEEAKPVFLAAVAGFLPKPGVGFIAGEVQIQIWEGLGQAVPDFRGKSSPSLLCRPGNPDRMEAAVRPALSIFSL
jgi:hypothetical protein